MHRLSMSGGAPDMPALSASELPAPIVIDGRYAPGVVITTFEGDFGHGWRAGFPDSKGRAPGVPPRAQAVSSRPVGGLPAAEVRPYDRRFWSAG